MTEANPFVEFRAAFNELLTKCVRVGASDIHIKPSEYPTLVINGRINRIKAPPFSAQDTKNLLYSILSLRQIKLFEENLELDASYQLDGVGRFRVNLYHTLDAPGAVIRVIPPVVRTVEQLGLPSVLKKFTYEPQGLVLVTGPTGSGKSTTLAAMIDYYNSTQDGHIVTIEDPIEALHPNKRSTVTQREVGRDTRSFQDALKSTLRQAPNVILIGELRDQETIALALKAAETGHLVFSTLHTSDAVQTLNRVINAFAPHEQGPIRIQLANVLRGTVAQRIVPRLDRPGRIVNYDILVVTVTARDYILKNEIDQLYEVIRNGAYDGMMSMNQSLLHNYTNGIIDYRTAFANTPDVNDFIRLAQDMMRGEVTSGGGPGRPPGVSFNRPQGGMAPPPRAPVRAADSFMNSAQQKIR